MDETLEITAYASSFDKESANKKVLAVIPAYNAEETIERSIRSLLRQDYPMLDIMVVDDCSTDATLEILQKYQAKILIDKNEKNLGLSKTLNKAVRFAREDYNYFLLLNDDVELASDDWISKAIKHFENKHVGCVCGEFSVSEPLKLSAAAKGFLVLGNEIFHEDGIRQIPFSLQKADLFKLSALVEIKGFGSIPNLEFGAEDHITGFKLNKTGYRLLKDPSLRAYLNFGMQQNSFCNLLKKEWLYGRSISWALTNGMAEVKTGGSEQFRKKVQYRKLKLLTVSFSTICFLGSLLMISLLFAGLLLQFAQFIRYLITAKSNKHVMLGNRDKIVFAAFGIASDWIYSLSFLYGCLTGIVWSIARYFKR